MKITPVRGLLLLGALSASLVTAQAQIVTLRATLSAQQENPPTSSPATGSAIMHYDVAANRFDLVVEINGMTNLATASHIHEGARGINGGVVTNLGGETAYVRTGGNTLRATFTNVTHGGDKLRLISGGAYFNIHSAQFPGGEVRGQMIPQPVRLVAILDTAQEQLAMPNVSLAGVNNFGGAVLLYDAEANRISLRHSLFNYNNPFTNSHIHEGAVGVSGPVRTALGTNPNADAYSNVNGHISGNHQSIPFVGDPLILLTGGMYLNYHSQTFAGGQLRGQIHVSNETASTRLANLSARGFVGTNDQVLIGGIVVTGSEPVRMLITAKGPSLSAAPFNVAGALANPTLALHDSAGRLIATNNDVGATAGTELASIQGVPSNTLESALVVVLPPGNYTAIVSSATGATGVALLESYDLRGQGSATVIVSREPVSKQTPSLAAAAAKGAVELCAAVPLAVAVK